MTLVQILIISTAIMFVAACITFLASKLIARNIYLRTIAPNTGAKKSPYGVEYVKSENGKWGYCVTKKGSILYSENHAKVFTTIEECVRHINQFEKIEGYEKTRV